MFQVMLYKLNNLSYYLDVSSGLGGQLKRINIAMELVSLARPALVLLDEPTSGLDAAIANELFENLYKLSRTGTM